jgi:cellulose biosynthesis protein BcsQ
LFGRNAWLRRVPWWKGAVLSTIIYETVEALARKTFHKRGRRLVNKYARDLRNQLQTVQEMRKAFNAQLIAGYAEAVQEYFRRRAVIGELAGMEEVLQAE